LTDIISSMTKRNALQSSAKPLLTKGAAAAAQTLGLSDGGTGCPPPLLLPLLPSFLVCLSPSLHLPRAATQAGKQLLCGAPTSYGGVAPLPPTPTAAAEVLFGRQIRCPGVLALLLPLFLRIVCPRLASEAFTPSPDFRCWRRGPRHAWPRRPCPLSKLSGEDGAEGKQRGESCDCEDGEEDGEEDGDNEPSELAGALVDDESCEAKEACSAPSSDGAFRARS